MTLIGMDVDQVRQMAQRISKAADETHQCAQRIDRVVAQAAGVWRGPDTQEFLGLWRGQYRPKLESLVADLRKYSEVATRNTQEQEKTSSAEGGPFAGIGAHGTGTIALGGAPALGLLPLAPGVRSFLKQVKGIGSKAKTVLSKKMAYELGKGKVALDELKGAKGLAKIRAEIKQGEKILKEVAHDSRGAIKGAKTVGKLGKGLAGVGIVLGVDDMIQGARSGNGWQVAGGAFDTVLGVASLFPPADIVTGPLGAAKGAFDTLVPYRTEDMDAIKNSRAELQYGKDYGSLDPSQRAEIDSRYQGAGNFWKHGVSDGLNQTISMIPGVSYKDVSDFRHEADVKIDHAMQDAGDWTMRQVNDTKKAITWVKSLF